MLNENVTNEVALSDSRANPLFEMRLLQAVSAIVAAFVTIGFWYPVLHYIPMPTLIEWISSNVFQWVIIFTLFSPPFLIFASCSLLKIHSERFTKWGYLLCWFLLIATSIFTMLYCCCRETIS